MLMSVNLSLFLAFFWADQATKEPVEDTDPSTLSSENVSSFVEVVSCPAKWFYLV